MNDNVKSGVQLSLPPATSERLMMAYQPSTGLVIMPKGNDTVVLDQYRGHIFITVIGSKMRSWDYPIAANLSNPLDKVSERMLAIHESFTVDNNVKLPITTDNGKVTVIRVVSENSLAIRQLMVDLEHMETAKHQEWMQKLRNTTGSDSNSQETSVPK